MWHGKLAEDRMKLRVKALDLVDVIGKPKFRDAVESKINLILMVN